MQAHLPMGRRAAHADDGAPPKRARLPSARWWGRLLALVVTVLMWAGIILAVRAVL